VIYLFIYFEALKITDISGASSNAVVINKSCCTQLFWDIPVTEFDEMCDRRVDFTQLCVCGCPALTSMTAISSAKASFQLHVPKSLSMTELPILQSECKSYLSASEMAMFM
jgi:hypothetical protein